MSRSRFPWVILISELLGFVIGSWAGLISVTLILAFGYWVSIRLNPRVAHRSCGGAGRVNGRIYTWTYHRHMGACGGTGQIIRWGARRWGTQAIREEAERRAVASQSVGR